MMLLKHQAFNREHILLRPSSSSIHQASRGRKLPNGLPELIDRPCTYPPQVCLECGKGFFRSTRPDLRRDSRTLD